MVLGVVLAAVSPMLTAGLLAVAQQLRRHIFSRAASRHFAKFNHSGTTILVVPNWFCDSSKNILLVFLSNPGFSC